MKKDKTFYEALDELNVAWNNLKKEIKRLSVYWRLRLWLLLKGK